ncbi:asparagine--tRNA ligase [Myxococcota bacterium]|nr:asparagine--tRNA ligase [Myxococcota bacterium]MBU1379743.1 asparagine--tRNA ligase [Myxococcota bacterium]MBU1498544.1 asparagine--tRNA ligase [Myxococcota bacterium]
MTIRIKEILENGKVGELISASGWIRTRRDSKTVTFIELNDGSCFKNLQVTLDASNHSEILSALGTGTSVTVMGNLVQSPAAGQAVELAGDTVKIIGSVESDYPLQKKRHSFEFLREIAHLRPRANTFGAVFRMRNILSFAVHEFFQSRGYVYLNSPIITTSDCEGAGEMFRVSCFDPEKIPRNDKNEIDWSRDFFGKAASLTVSGQLEAEIFATSLGNCYTFGPTFRAENSNTSRHLAEFWMIEPEIAFADLKEDMNVAEDFVRYLFKAALSRGGDDLDFFDDRIEKGLKANLERLADAPFERITYTDAMTELEKHADSFEFKPSWGIDLQSEHERFITEKIFNGPVFVTDYPKDIKAFYMRLNEDEKTVAAMDLLMPRVGEIIGGSQREERYNVLVDKIKTMGLNIEDYWWYLDLRKYGTIPHAGFGLGFERMVQFVTGMSNIRDVIPFPRAPKLADF